MVKLARRIGEHVDKKRSDVEEHGLVVDKQLAKEAHILHIQLGLRAIDLPEDVRAPLVHAAPGRMGIGARLAVRMVRRRRAHVLEAARTHPQRRRIYGVRTRIPRADRIVVKENPAGERGATYRSSARPTPGSS